MSELTDKLKRMAEFDLANMGPPNRQHRWRNEGALAENARLAPLLDALIEYTRYAPEVLASLDDGLHVSLHADLVKALAKLQGLGGGR